MEARGYFGQDKTVVIQFEHGSLRHINYLFTQGAKVGCVESNTLDLFHKFVGPTV